jgi:hypothetical protein
VPGKIQGFFVPLLVRGSALTEKKSMLVYLLSTAKNRTPPITLKTHFRIFECTKI